MRYLLGVAAGIVVAASGAGAMAQDSMPADRIAALKQCRAIPGDTDRLACLDRVSGEVVDAAERGEIRIVTRKDVEETRRGLFGFTLPKIKLFEADREEGREPLETLESVVTSARRIDAKTYQFKIRDGEATWQIKEAPARFIGPKAGDKVAFKRATLGSFFIRINDQVGVKGRRID